jgi:hypothetical protein
VGLVVRFVNNRTFYHYLPAATSQKKQRVDPRYEDGRQSPDQALPHHVRMSQQWWVDGVLA